MMRSLRLALLGGQLLATAVFIVLTASIQPPPLPAEPLPMADTGELMRTPDHVTFALDTEPIWSRATQPQDTQRVTIANDQCQGHGDTSPGCAADPAPWVCTHEGKGGATKCGCKIQCAHDGDRLTVSETADCPRFCSDKCFCHIEEECPDVGR